VVHGCAVTCKLRIRRTAALAVGIEQQHPLMAPNSEALAGDWLPVADAFDERVPYNGMRVFANKSICYGLGLSGVGLSGWAGHSAELFHFCLTILRALATQTSPQ
jgi:hypothetical protein